MQKQVNLADYDSKLSEHSLETASELLWFGCPKLHHLQPDRTTIMTNSSDTVPVSVFLTWVRYS